MCENIQDFGHIFGFSHRLMASITFIIWKKEYCIESEA